MTNLYFMVQNICFTRANKWPWSLIFRQSRHARSGELMSLNCFLCLLVLDRNRLRLYAAFPSDCSNEFKLLKKQDTNELIKAYGIKMSRSSWSPLIIKLSSEKADGRALQGAETSIIYNSAVSHLRPYECRQILVLCQKATWKLDVLIFLLMAQAKASLLFWPQPPSTAGVSTRLISGGSPEVSHAMWA